MTALSADRNNLKTRNSRIRSHPVAASTVIYKGALVCKVGGYAAPALNTTGYSDVIGYATAKRDNSSGAAGALDVPVESGVSIPVAVTGGVQAFEQGQIVFVADDQTVSTTTASGVRAGLVEEVESSTSIRLFIPLGGMGAGR